MKTFLIARMIAPSLLLVAASFAAGTAGAQAPAAQAPAATPPPSSVPSPGPAMKSVSPTTIAPKSGNTDPTGATAKCKDGTYSKSKHHSGACSKHGGVAQWMDGSK